MLLSVWGGLRLAYAINSWRWLQHYLPTPGPLYVAVSGGLWAAAALAAVLSLALRWAWTERTCQIIAAAFALWYWGDRLYFSRSADSQANTPFYLGFTVICLVYVVAALRRQQQRNPIFPPHP